jgi:formiminotetrahydrofolate cyclodeaminase
MISMEQDAEAFTHYLEVVKSTDQNSLSPSPDLLQAVSGISHIPLMIANKCLLLMELAVNATQFGNQNALADSINAYSLAKTAAEGSLLNVTVNTRDYLQHPSIQPFSQETRDLTTKIAALQSKMNDILQSNKLETITLHE